MYSKTIFLINNNPKLEEKHLQNKIDDSTYSIKPFDLPNEKTIDQLLDIANADIAIDFSKIALEPVRETLLNNYQNIDKSKITEEWHDADHNVDSNYGAISNLNSRLFPVEYFYQQIILSDKTFDDDGNATSGNLQGYDLNNTLTFNEIYTDNLREYYYLKWKELFFEKYLISIEPEIKKMIKTMESKLRPAIKEVVDNFYSHVFQLFEDNYKSSDNFYVLVEIIRDYLIPEIFQCFILIMEQYDHSQFLESTLLMMLICDQNLMDYTIPFYDHIKFKNHSLFKNVVVFNSFISMDKLNKYQLKSLTTRYIEIKLSDLDEYNNYIFTDVDEAIKGYCNSIYDHYKYNETASIYLPFNSNGFDDYFDLNDFKSRLIVKTDVQYKNTIEIKNVKHRGIINQDKTVDNRLTNFQVVDNLNDVDQLIINQNYIDDAVYLMLDNIDRDTLDDYLENNDVTKKHFYLNLTSLDLSLDDEDDLRDYIDHVKSYNCKVSCLVTVDQLKTYDEYLKYQQYFNKICLIIETDDILSIEQQYQYLQVETCLKNVVDNQYIYQIYSYILQTDYVFKTLYIY